MRYIKQIGEKERNKANLLIHATDKCRLEMPFCWVKLRFSDLSLSKTLPGILQHYQSSYCNLSMSVFITTTRRYLATKWKIQLHDKLTI